MAYVRTVKTASGATAVQIVHSSRKGSRKIEHLGSAHNDAEIEALKIAAAKRLAGDQDELDLGIDLPCGVVAPGAPLPIVGSRMGHLWEGLSRAYDVLGFDEAAEGDEVFRQLVLARIIEPTSKLDSIRVLEEVGITPVSYPTMNRRLPGYAKDTWRQALAAVCAQRAAIGPASLVLYDVTTLYFETDKADGFREPGFSKERRLEPQITVGLLTDATGFPLMIEAFEGNKAETHTMLPTIKAFLAVHQLREVVVVADAGMISEANREALEDAGLSYVIGARIPEVPWCIKDWRSRHPDGEAAVPEDQQVFTAPWPATGAKKAAGRRDKVTYYQYRHDRARRTLRGIDEQVGKAEKAVAGRTAVKRNRFVKLSGGTKSVNRDLESKSRALAGFKAYITNMLDPDPDTVIGAYHQLWRIEQSFRMSKSDLQARPIYHRKRASIEAHLAVVFAALAITRYIEDRTGMSIKKFVQTTRRFRTVQINVGGEILTAEDPLPPELRDALAQIG